MIDLHIHILPGLDDGPSSLEEAIEMCILSSDEGIHTLVATPHVIREVYDNTRDIILHAVESLNTSLSRKRIPIKVLPGADVHLDHDVIERLENMDLCTLNDNKRYILLELPETLSGLHLTRAVSALRKRGLCPVLSHPERSPSFQQNVERLYNLVNSGVLVQITARSLMGGFGKEAKRFAEKLLKHRLVHIIASDAHASTTRAPGLLGAVKRAITLTGEEEALKMVQETPSNILRGVPITPPPPIPWAKTRKFWLPFSA